MMDVMPNEFCNCHVRLADLAFSPNGYAPSKHLAIKIMPLDELGVISRPPIDERNIISNKIFQYSAAHRWKAETLSFPMVYVLK